MRKFLIAVFIAFILLSCDTEPMSTEINPFIGAWVAIETNVQTSAIIFTENKFTYSIYTVTISDPLNPSVIEKKYKGNYRYNENSATIFFEVLEPVDEKGVTSSSYQFYDNKLYCYGDKITVTETLHEKQTLPQ